MTGHCNQVRTFSFGNVYDCFHDRAMNDTRLGLNPFLAELASSGGQIKPGFILVRRSHVSLGMSVGYASFAVSGSCRTNSTGQGL